MSFQTILTVTIAAVGVILVIASAINGDGGNLEGQVINGHEITITNALTTPNGDLVFACNDTADGSEEPTYMLAQNLLEKVHHAGLPKEAVGDMEVPKVSDWVEYFKQYAAA